MLSTAAAGRPGGAGHRADIHSHGGPGAGQNAGMALPRRGSRTLYVEGHAIRWVYTYRRHPDGDCVLVAQAVGGGDGARLVVLLPWRVLHFWSGRLGKWPLPTVWAAACIRAALRHGWAPHVRGPEVHRTMTDLQLAMPLPPIATKVYPS